MKRESISVVRCVEQLRIGQHTSIGWISDGSASKVVYGKLWFITESKNGLCLHVTTDQGKASRVNWRMPKHIAWKIDCMFVKPIAVPFMPLHELESISYVYSIHERFEPYLTPYCFDRPYDTIGAINLIAFI